MVEHKSESGQAIILIMIGIVALLGFAALAIDGGMVYADRRNAQNGADAAALAGALQKSNNASTAQIIAAAQNSLAANGFDYSSANIFTSQYTDYSGAYTLVTVEFTSTTETVFAQLLTGGDEMTNVVMASARARMSQPALPEMAIVAMGNCMGGDPALISGTGGGNSGGVRTKKGGIFLNTPGDDGCALQPPNNGYGVQANPTCPAGETCGVWSIGPTDYASDGSLQPRPAHTMVNGGAPISDPLPELPTPQCTVAGHQSGGKWQPGNYNGIPTGDLAPGIYCISGSTHLSGHSSVDGTGVVLYFINGGFNFTGQGHIEISAPNSSNCLGTQGDPTASCTFAGIAIYAARNNTSSFEIRGNGESHIRGLVYAISGSLEARGGGCDPNDAIVYGQAIVKNVSTNGGGDVAVQYEAGYTYWQPTKLSLWR